jgi:beta-lactamase regulating signal transducer with metallopeptidase domain
MMDINLMQGVESASRVVANSFVSGIWEGIVLAAGVGICLRLVPKTTAAVRFAIWTAVFGVLAVLPLVHAYSLNSVAGTPGRAAWVHADVRWSFVIAAVWLAASLTRGVKLAISAVRLRGIWKRAKVVEGCDEVLQAAGFDGVQICTSNEVDRPSVIGFFSPRILIPKELFAKLTTAEFGQIVLHEVGHLRRADDWINLLQKVSLVVFPLNPVLMWIERRLCLERELACDDEVLRLTKAPKAYATCLTNLAEHRLGRRAAALSLGAWEKQSELARRVHSILRGGEGMGRTQARVMMGVLVAALLGGSVELARSPQFVSFSGTTMPVTVASDSAVGDRSAGYQAVAFREQNNRTGVPHETLLKASMPVNRQAALMNREPANSIKRPSVPVKKAAAKRRRVPPVLQSRVAMPELRRAQGVVVLTSWDEAERPGIVFAVTEERVISASYAAVRTPGGWLVIQL